MYRLKALCWFVRGLIHAVDFVDMNIDCVLEEIRMRKYDHVGSTAHMKITAALLANTEIVRARLFADALRAVF